MVSVSVNLLALGWEQILTLVTSPLPLWNCLCFYFLESELGFSFRLSYMLTQISLFHRLVEMGKEISNTSIEEIVTTHIFMCLHVTARNPFIFWIVEPSDKYPTCLMALCSHCSMSQAFDFYLSDNAFAICQSPYAFIFFWALCFVPWSFMLLCLCLSVWMIMWGHSLGRCWERMITCSESTSQRHHINENLMVRALG